MQLANTMLQDRLEHIPNQEDRQNLIITYLNKKYRIVSHQETVECVPFSTDVVRQYNLNHIDVDFVPDFELRLRFDLIDASTGQAIRRGFANIMDAYMYVLRRQSLLNYWH